MKAINLFPLVQINDLNNSTLFDQFLKLNHIKFKSQEVHGIKFLLNELINQQLSLNLCDDFYVGYQIPQIGKEFDLLRFGKNFNINIEIKSTLDTNKILNQLRKNKYYLKFLNKPVCYICFAYDEETNIFLFYQLNKKDNLIQISAKKVARLLVKQKLDKDILIDRQFSPSNYLVSPFNSTDNFLKDEYFLTQDQEVIKKQIEQLINGNSVNFISLTGSAGTGKTLLTYNIAFNLRKQNKNVKIVHCGYLNDGHEKLRDKGWDIIFIKFIESYLDDNYDVLIIDEAQRIYERQFNKIIEKITEHNKKCIFSFDEKQTLHTSETNRNIADKILNIKNIQNFKLSEKIRTNKEISDFIKGLFDNKRNNLIIPNTGNIELLYFGLLNDAIKYINNISNEWKILIPTSSSYSLEYHDEYLCQLSSEYKKNAHNVIGQEFDNVVVIIDKFFDYQHTGKLIYSNNTYYDATKMLFQNLTRTRKKLKIIIIENQKILSRCLDLLS